MSQPKKLRRTHHAPTPAPVNVESVVLRYADAAPGVLAEHFAVDCCLNVAWVTLRVLGAHGVSARTASVYAEARSQRGNHIVSIDTAGAPTLERWPGHLVVVAGALLVDGAAALFRRPRARISFPRIIAAKLAHAKKFLEGGECAQYRDNATGATLTYQVRPGDRSYAATPGFRASSHNESAARAVLERMKLCR